MIGYLQKKDNNFYCLSEKKIEQDGIAIYFEGNLFLNKKEEQNIFRNLARNYKDQNILLKLNGQFVITIWDNRNKILVIVRDRFGTIPLYYSNQKSKLVFGSSLNSLFDYCDEKVSLNTSVVHEYFMFRYVSGENTLVKNVYQLAPGCALELNQQNTLVIKRYHQFEYATDRKAHDISSTEKFEEAFWESMRRHTTDKDLQKIGVLSSGGIDSSILVACSEKIFNSRFNTYYIGSQNYKFNRIDEVNYLSNKFKTNQKNILITGKNFADHLLDTVKINEFPLNHPSSVLRNYLYKQIGNETSTVLSGEGADCFYCGYYIFDLINYFYIKNPVRTLSHLFSYLLPVSLIPANYQSRMRKIKNLMILPPDRYAIFYDLLNSNSEPGLKLLLDIDIPADFAENYTSLFSDYNKKTILNTILNIYQTLYIVESLITLTKLGAANKIEHRHPFIDNKMVDLFNSFSWQDKIGFFKRKKQIVALGKKYLEKDFFAKRKEGFGVPLKDWFYDEKNLGKFLGILSDKKTKERGIFNINYLEKILNEFHHRKLSDDAFENILWPIINFELWYRLYIDKDL